MTKAVEKLLNVTKKDCNRATYNNMYVIQIYTIACVSICNSELVVIEFGQQIKRFPFSKTLSISKKFNFYALWC